MNNQNQNSSNELQDYLKIGYAIGEHIAKTVIPLLRTECGRRFLSPTGLVVTAAVLGCIGARADDQYRSQDLLVFVGISLAAAFYQRHQRRQEAARGIRAHSLYVGTSRLHRLKWPAWLRRERRIERFADPLFCYVLGQVLSLFSPAVGSWITLSAVCLGATEHRIHKEAVKQRHDLADGLIEAEIRSGHVEELETLPASAGQTPGHGMPTGLGADITKIKNN